jgi:hypothetical protein
MASTSRSGSPTTVVQRKRTGDIQVRKTVHFLLATIDRLERYAFDQRLPLWKVIDAAAVEYLDRHAPVPSRRKTSAPPSAPPSTRRSSPPKSKRT